jgi:hypothetical protein
MFGILISYIPLQPKVQISGGLHKMRGEKRRKKWKKGRRRLTSKRL